MTAALALLLALAAQALPPRTILAVGAHCGDMEITTGAILARHARAGDRVVILHLTLGERGNPKLAPEAYGAQKRREAEEAARVLGAEVLFGPYRDAELPDDEPARRYVAEVIRKIRPTHILTHWKNSIHRDHAATHAIVRDALLLASVEGVAIAGAPHRGIRGVYYADNWEDDEGFQPYLSIDVSADFERWRQCVTKYEFIRGGISSFPYLDYYEALARLRGARAGVRHAVALDVDEPAKRRVSDVLP